MLEADNPRAGLADLLPVPKDVLEQLLDEVHGRTNNKGDPMFIHDANGCWLATAKQDSDE
jgi:hypothetical protein